MYTGLEEEGQVLPQKSWTIHGLWPGELTRSPIAQPVKLTWDRFLQRYGLMVLAVFEQKDSHYMQVLTPNTVT